MTSPVFFHVKVSDNQQFVFKTNRNITDQEKELIQDMALEMADESSDSSAKTRIITIQKIKKREITYKESTHGKEQRVANKLIDITPSERNKPIEIKELTFSTSTKEGWKKNLLNKVGKWSFFVPVVGWGIGAAWLISRHQDKKKMLQLATQAGHQLEKRSVADLGEFIDAHKTMIDKLERLKDDLPPDEIEKYAQLDIAIVMLKDSQKTGRKICKCNENEAQLNKTAEELAAKIVKSYSEMPSQGPIRLVPTYYYTSSGDIQPVLLHFYKDENNDLCMQRIEIRPDSQNSFDTITYKVKRSKNTSEELVEEKTTDPKEEDLSLASEDVELVLDAEGLMPEGLPDPATLLKGIFRFQIPPQRHEETYEDKTVDKLKILAQKATQSIGKEGESTVDMTTDPSLALSAEIEAHSVIMEDQSKKSSHTRAPGLMKPFQIFVRGQFGDDTLYSKLTDIRDQMETLSSLADMLSKDTGKPLSKRIERLQNLISMVEASKSRAKKQIGSEEAWSFFMEEKEKQLNALIADCRESIKKSEASLSKNRPKLIEKLGRKAGDWKGVRLQDTEIVRSPPSLSLNEDSHLERLSELSETPNITANLSHDKSIDILHLKLLTFLHKKVGKEEATLKDYQEILKDQDALEDIATNFYHIMAEHYPREAAFQGYYTSEEDSIRYLINEINGKGDLDGIKQWQPLLKYILELKKEEPSAKTKQEIQLINNDAENAQKKLSEEIDHEYKIASELFSEVLQTCRAALDAPKGEHTEIYRKRLQEVDRNIAKMINELPIPKIDTDSPNNFWRNLNPEDIEVWETHVHDAMAIWTEARTRLGEPTISGENFVIMARGMTISNHLFRLKGQLARNLLTEKWTEFLASDHPRKEEIQTSLREITDNSSLREIVEKRHIFALGWLGQQLGMDKDQLFPILFSDYSVGNETIQLFIKQNPSTFSSLSDEQTNALREITKYNAMYQGGAGNGSRGAYSDTSFLRFDQIDKYISDMVSQPELNLSIEIQQFLAGFNCNPGSDLKQKKTESSEIKKEICREIFASFSAENSSYLDPSFVKALHVNLFCRILLNPERLGIAFKDEQQAALYYLTQVKALSLESIEAESFQNTAKKLIKQDSLKTQMEKMGSWQLRVNPENLAVEITDREQNALVQYSESDFDLGAVTIEAAISAPGIFSKEPRKEAYDQLHRCLLADDPVKMVQALKSEILGQVVVTDPEITWKKTIVSEKAVQDFVFQGGYSTGLTPEQERDLACIEIAPLRASDARRKIVHYSTVNQAFTFIASYPELLSNVGVQQRLRDILARPELLQRALHLDPGSVITFGNTASILLKEELQKEPTSETVRKVLFLTELCLKLRQNVQQSQESMKDLDTNSYFGKEEIFLSDDFTEIVDHLNTMHAIALETIPSYSTPFNDGLTLEQILKSWVSSDNPKIHDMAKEINLYVVQSFMGKNLATLENDQWTELFQAYGVIANTGGTVLNTHLEQSIVKWMSNHAINVFKGKLNGPDRKELLEKLTKRLLPSVNIPSDAEWREIIPGMYQCLSRQKELSTLDLTKALVFDQNGNSNAKSPIPNEIKKNLTFSRVFENDLPESLNAQCFLGNKPGVYIYQFTHQDHPFQIQHDTLKNEVTICQEIENHLYVFEPSPAISGNGTQLLIKNRGLWRNQDNPREARCMLGKQDDPHPEMTLFLSFKPQKGPSLFSTEKLIDIASRKGGVRPPKILELHSVTMANGKEVINANAEALEELFGFVDTKDVLLLGQKGKVDEIRFLELNIILKQTSMVIDGKKQVVWKVESSGNELDGCILLKDASTIVDVFGSDYKNFMLPLYDPTSKTCKIVMRPLELQHLSIAGEKTTVIANTALEKRFQSSKFTIFFNPQDKSISTTTGGFMNLAYLAAAKGHYEKAAEHLNQAMTAPAPTDPKAKQEALEMMKHLGNLIRSLPQESTKGDLFRLKFELVQMKVMREQFGQEEFQLKRFQERLQYVQEVSELFEAAKVRQEKKPISGLLKLTPEEISEYEGFVQESLSFLFDKVTETPRTQSPSLSVRIPSGDMNSSALALGLTNFAQKPNPGVTIDHPPAYLTATGLLTNFPSYWNDIVLNKKGKKDLMPLLRGVIAETNSHDQQLVKDSISLLFALATCVDENIKVDPFPDVEYPEMAKRHGDLTFKEIGKLAEMNSSMNLLIDFLENFVEQTNRSLPEEAKTLKLKGRNDEKNEDKSASGMTIDTILAKLDDPALKDKFSSKEIEEWKSALNQIKDEMARSPGEGVAQELQLIELIQKLMGKGVIVPLQRYQRILEQRSTESIAPPTTATVPRSSQVVVDEEKSKTSDSVDKWEETKKNAFNSSSLLKPAENSFAQFKEKMRTSKEFETTHKNHILAVLNSNDPAADLLKIKLQMAEANDSEKVSLWLQHNCLELKLAHAKLTKIKENLSDPQAVAFDLSNLDHQMTITAAQIESLKADPITRLDFTEDLKVIRSNLLEARALYVQASLSLDPSIDTNLESMIEESNRLTKKASTTTKVQEELKRETPDIVAIDQVEKLQSFVKVQESALKKESLEAQKKVLDIAEMLSLMNLQGASRELLLFQEKVRLKEQFSNDEITRFATDLYLDNHLQNNRLTGDKKKVANELHEAIESFMTLQIQYKGIAISTKNIASATENVEKLAKLKQLFLSGKLNTPEKMAGFEKNWEITSKELFALLERSQKAERHLNIKDDLIRRSIIRMEWKQGFPLREDQISNFQKLIDNPEELLLFRTGGGKSSVFFPLAVEVLLRKGKFPFQLVTEKLHQQFLDDMDPKTRELFLQGAYPV